MKGKNERILMVMLPNGGTGNVSPRLSLPNVWIKDMGIEKNDRQVKVTYKDGIITIKKLDKNIEEVK